jgi:hypothetical protein
MLYGLLIFLSAAAIYLTFGLHDRALALFGATGLAAHGILIVIACCLILAYFQLGEEFPVAGGAEGGPAAAAASALELTMDIGLGSGVDSRTRRLRAPRVPDDNDPVSRVYPAAWSRRSSTASMLLATA